jgi:hypothetical protein
MLLFCWIDGQIVFLFDWMMIRVVERDENSLLIIYII